MAIRTRMSDWINNWSFFLTVFFFVLSAFASSWIQLHHFIWKPDPFDDILPAVDFPVNDNILDDKLDKIFWFIQISDLHLSINFDPRRGPDFEKWINQVVIEAIKPKVTLVTGDLTDARTKGIMGGEQYEQEWIWYQEIVNRTGVTDKTLWLDLRGNHDDFGVFDWKSDNNYFAKYSVQGRHHKRHYTYTVKEGNETYSFIGVDSCLEPGPNRPFNTVGLLHEEDIDSLKALKKSLVSPNFTVWFGHYPTRAITGPIPGLHNIINGPYLSGHVHMTDLYALQPPGFLDIEVADWKTKRMYRVAVIDHSIFSFTDIRLDEWPVIVITNPKAAKFVMPKIEAVNRIQFSTHIRVLVFSRSNLTRVTLEINDEEEVVMTRVKSSPLFVSQWNPSKYSSGLHRMTVKAKDEGNNVNQVTQYFSLDGSREDFSFKSKLVMTFMHQTVWGTAFFICLWFVVTPLLVIRLTVFRCQSLKNKAREASCSILVKLSLLCSVNKMFLPIIVLPLYLSFGPWMAGRVIEGHFGTCFVWGTFIEGSFLPGGVSYILALVFLLVVQVPFILCLSHCIHCRFLSLVNPSSDSASRLASFSSNFCHLRNFVMILIFCFHFLFSFVYGDAYGLIAWILGFAHTWTLVLNIFVWWSSHRLQLADFKDFKKNNNRVRSPVHVQRREEDSTDLINADKDRTE